jgi:ubiquinone/menaquinone biosynthesis C-methylase UbiE
MGIRLHLCCDDHRIDGYEHHDPKVDGWRFEDGLPYPDGSVECITISHGLSQISEEGWNHACGEFFRVLEVGGIIRITDDDTESLTSKRRENPFPGVNSLTGPYMARRHLRAAGFVVADVGPYATHFKDTSILIHLRIAKPSYVFYIEGAKPGA